MYAKVAILFASLAAVHASVLPYHHGAALISTGSSISSRQQDGFGNYAFGYGIADGTGATNSRSEVGDAHGNKKGAYTLTDIDGRARRVDYVADGHGFRASVKTNEPGTAASAPAAALINSPYAAPVAPVDLAHAGLAVAAAPALVTGAAINHIAPAVAPVLATSLINHAAPYAVPGVLASSAINHVAPVAAPLALGHLGLGLGHGLINHHGIY